MSVWYTGLMPEFIDQILPIDQDIATIWALLRVPNYENALDKLITATALIYSLQILTRNIKDFEKPGVQALNPFASTN